MPDWCRCSGLEHQAPVLQRSEKLEEYGELFLGRRKPEALGVPAEPVMPEEVAEAGADIGRAGCQEGPQFRDRTEPAILATVGGEHPPGPDIPPWHNVGLGSIARREAPGTQQGIGAWLAATARVPDHIPAAALARR